MGVLGEMFPGAKIADEAGEAGDGQPWRLGPIDLDNNVVEVHRGPSPAAADESPAAGASADVQSAVPSDDGNAAREKWVPQG